MEPGLLEFASALVNLGLVAAAGHLVIGSGIRASKILCSGAVLAALPGAQVLPLAKAG